jgi:hypothetical protein
LLIAGNRVSGLLDAIRSGKAGADDAEGGGGVAGALSASPAPANRDEGCSFFGGRATVNDGGGGIPIASGVIPGMCRTAMRLMDALPLR